MKQNIYVFLCSKSFQKILFIITGIIVLILILFFSLRNTILHNIIEKKVISFNQKYPAKLIVEEASFTGLTSVEFHNVMIILDKKDTLLSASSIKMNLKLFPMFLGNVKIRNLEICSTVVNLVKKDSLDNFSFLLSKKNKEKDINERNYTLRLDRLADIVFDNIPENLSLNKFTLKALFDKNSFSVFFDKFLFKNKSFYAPIRVSEGKNDYILITEGNIDKRSRIGNVKLYSKTGRFTVPIVQKKYGLLFSFDTLQFGLLKNKIKETSLMLNGYIMFNGLLLNHQKISLTDVKMDKIAFKYNFRIGSDFVEIDSSSSVTYNKIELHPYILYKKADFNQYTFKLNDEFSAQNFFESLPTGLFTNFEGIKTSGQFKLSVDFFVDMKIPDSLKYNASFTSKDFKVIKYGITDFTKINQPFTYTYYSNGNPVKSFIVGTENPEFTPLEEISTCLKEAVLISENGDYYFSSGINKEEFRRAIIENIKAKRFVRGGSTIDMQLVKNVFLNRNKTIARKIEEMLIVWLIQTNNICTKDRMYEIYLNVIEWGPGINGVYEASKYYFNKHPSQLTLAESIYMASIIPRPKWFKYSFDKNGNLNKDLNHAYFSQIAKLMLEKAIIAISDTNNLLSKVKLKGESKLYLAKDTANFNLDSLMNEKD